MEQSRKLIVLMGPSGCGKSTIGQLLAQVLDLPFVEGDDHHPTHNVRKMAAGQPLDDADREAWIDGLVAECRSSPAPALVLACSALTPYVQSRLRAECDRRVSFVLLDLPEHTLRQRVDKREGHFMPAELTGSQLAVLDPPADALKLDATRDPQAIVGRLCTALGHRREKKDDRKAGKTDNGGG